MPSERTLKRIVIVLGVLLVAGFAVLVATIVYRLANPGWKHEEKAAAPAPAPATEIPAPADEDSGMVRLQTPEGAEVLNIAFAQDIIIVAIRSREGVREKLVFDGSTGTLLGRLVDGNADENLPDPARQD